MRSARGPQRLGDALSELVALKGLARSGAAEQLSQAWQEVAGERIALETRVVAVKNRSLEIEVSSAALMYELDSFHKSSLLEALAQQPGLQINRLKFRLKGSLGEDAGGGK
jgi:predicted nucleic acid-binding Zn ribbon protein